MKAFSHWLCVSLVIACPLTSTQADTVIYNYDNAGRLTTAGYGAGKSIAYTYDTAGNITRKVFAIITDTDNDGMDDSWENSFFQTTTRDGSGDFDNDGMSDLAEFLAGTLPNNPGSLLRILTPSGTDLNPGAFTISWTSVQGKVYRLQHKLSLNDPQWTDISGDVLAAGATASKVHSPLPAGSAGFYRVAVLP